MLVPLLGVEPRELLLLREPTLPICPEGLLWHPRKEFNLRNQASKARRQHHWMGYCLVVPTGNDPVSIGYQPIALPLSYGTIVKFGSPAILSCRTHWIVSNERVQLGCNPCNVTTDTFGSSISPSIPNSGTLGWT